MTDKELIEGIDEMIEQAPGVGLCAFPFKILRDGVNELIESRDALVKKAYELQDELDTLKVPSVGYAEDGVEFSDVLGFIGRFSTDGNKERDQVRDAFLFGCCWWFAFILKSRFEREYPCQIVVDYAANHFACRINGNIYDITGLRRDGIWELWDDCDDESLKERITADCINF